MRLLTARIPRLLWALGAMGVLAGAAVVFVINTVTVDSDASLKQLSLTALERRLTAIDQQLVTLAKPSMRTGVGAVGYRSTAYADSAHPAWIHIELQDACDIDQVVLVPTIWRDTEKGFQADGFPLEFCIRVGLEGDQEGTVVARFDADDHLLPRVAPLVISFPSLKASWVRLEATTLSPRGWDGKHLLQLSEILVFSQRDNVALRQPVQVSSSGGLNHELPRHKDYLVDGFVPYLMDAYEGEQSPAFVSRKFHGITPVLSLDLLRPQPVSSIHLHATELSDNIPQALTDGFGIPRALIVEGANKEDFSDGVQLCDYQMESIYDSGPIIMRRFPETTCRYIRLIVTEPNTYSGGAEPQARVGFAEIEVFANGINVALDAPVRINLDPDRYSRSPSALTDGNNLYGRILPIRDWLTQLAMRHDLETQRPLLTAELKKRYQQQASIVRYLSWLAGLLSLIAICTILIERTIRQRAVFRTRERIAADLHDELGANLHAIGLLGDLAQANAEHPDQVKPLLQRARALTERSGSALRYCSNMLESEGLFGDLMEDMRRMSGSVMADLEHELSFEGEHFVRQLKASIRIDLFLFYKECLTNILKHSRATRVVTQLTADRNGLTLKVTDNGCGLDEKQRKRVPTSLSRRARLAGAKVSADRLGDGGTSITLKWRNRKLGWLW